MKIKSIAVGILMAGLAGSALGQHPVCDPKSTLAMEYLYSIFGDRDSEFNVWLNHEYGAEGRLRLERRENKLEKLAVWAATLAPEDRRAYLGAIDYYEDGAKKAYAEWHTHDLQHRQEAYTKHLRECAEEARRVAASQKALPKPPKGISGERP